MVRLTKPRLEIECAVTGYVHADAARVITDLQPGMPVWLERDPNNAYDPFAIEVWWQKSKRTKKYRLGFVPAFDETNIPLAMAIDQGHGGEAEITAVDPTLRAKNKRITIKVVVW